MIRYKVDTNILSINGQMSEKGLLVYLRHNRNLYKLLVPDTILVNNISKKTYDDFRRLAELRKERIPSNLFVLPKSKTQDASFENSIVNYNISSFVETFKRLKIWHGYLSMLVLSQPNTLKEITNPREYVLNITRNIASNATDDVIRQIANRAFEEMQTLNMYFVNTPMLIQYGMSLPLIPEVVRITNKYMIFILIFVFILIGLIIWYYIKFRKEEDNNEQN